MSSDISQVQKIAIGTGEVVVPGVASYDEASEGWWEREHRAATPDGIIAAAWEGEPGWVRIDHWPYTEVCVILSGSVEVVDPAGNGAAFCAGEAFVIPEGFVGMWRTLEPSRKIFVAISAPEAGAP